MSFLDLKQLSRSFGGGHGKVEVLRDVNLEVGEGEFVAIVGYSGAGKTTLISLMAGLLMPDRGRALCNGATITGPGRERAIVFQNYSLLPWLSVFDNIRLAVDQTFPDWSPRRRAEHINHFIAMVNLTAARDKKPPQLSGGMRQRVSVARALAMDPSVLLLDEPLSALDALTRATLQDEIGRIWRENRKTVVLITNDVDEGILLADRIVPLSAGPGATLGPSIPVDLPRPRDRKAINHCERFKTLRREVFDWLRGPGSKQGRAAEAAAARATRELALPKLRPADLSGGGGGFSWRLKRSQPAVAVGVSEAPESAV